VKLVVAVLLLVLCIFGCREQRDTTLPDTKIAVLNSAGAGLFSLIINHMLPNDAEKLTMFFRIVFKLYNIYILPRTKGSFLAQI
jgi:hypothetical protein